jgi:indolepyruvate ferredoxin oxidoreductase alpha subunit
MIREVLASEKASTAFLLGNEAIARGALEGGVSVYAGYPGSPTVELLETLMDIGPRMGMATFLSTNEKVALETAAGAAMAGHRALVSMKSVGLNVAADAFFSLCYTGVKGGLVLVVADDPHAHSSQSEQDGRLYAAAAEAPMLEPATPQEALEMTSAALDLSARHGVPVILRTVTRVNHQSGIVTTRPLAPRKHGKLLWEHEPGRFVTVAASARAFHQAMVRRTAQIAAEFDGSPLNAVSGSGGLGILTAGAAWLHTVEACRMLGVEPAILKLGAVWPFPEGLIGRFVEGLETLLVVEELSPFMEEAACRIARTARPGLEIVGKLSGDLPKTLEYNADIVADVLARLTGTPRTTDTAAVMEAAVATRAGIPDRPPTFCPGCPHRASISILREALRGVRHVVASDIGCYSMAPMEPHRWGDSVLSMGSSLGVAAGLAVSVEEKVVAIIGDSTLFHAGLPGLVDAAWRNSDFRLVVLDNGVTAMTGQQTHPGTGEDTQRPGMRRIVPEAVIGAMGVEDLVIVDPYDRASALPAVRESLSRSGFGVIIFRRECALHSDRRKRRTGVEIAPSTVTEGDCRNYHTCVRGFACPAISLTEEGRAEISGALCDGCGCCAQLCPNSAIVAPAGRGGS